MVTTAHIIIYLKLYSDSENRKEDKMRSMKHIVSLEVLGHLAHVNTPHIQ